MLKHMLNGNATAMTAGAADLPGRVRHAAIASACVSEPEYQNTTRRLSSSSPPPPPPTAAAYEFYGEAPAAKSVRSLENAATVAVGICEPEARARRSAPLDASWTTQAQPQQRPSAPQHRLNLSDATSNFSALATGAFTPIANGPTKPLANGGLHIAKPSPAAHHRGAPAVCAGADHGQPNDEEAAAIAAAAEGSDGVNEMLSSLGLLCLVSLLLALLSLLFLLKISPPPATAADMKELMRTEQLTLISPDEYVTVYQVTLALCSLTLSLNLCCLLVCCVQFLFAVKLTRSALDNRQRTNNYLQKSAATRVCAIAGFFISIPVFLTGVILYTFIQFHSTPAIVTSVLVGSGIVFCGCAMVHNVFVWQKEKTNAVKELVRQRRLRPRTEAGDRPDAARHLDRTSAPAAAAAYTLGQTTAAAAAAAVDRGSASRASHELSTLV